MSNRRIYGEEESQDGAAGSEFGKKQREEARRKKYGIVTKEFKVEDQPWILKVNGKAGKRYCPNIYLFLLSFGSFSFVCAQVVLFRRSKHTIFLCILYVCFFIFCSLDNTKCEYLTPPILLLSFIQI